MSDDASTSESSSAGMSDAAEEPHWSDKIPMWGPAILLVVLAIVMQFAGEPEEAVASTAPAAPAEAAAAAPQGDARAVVTEPAAPAPAPEQAAPEPAVAAVAPPPAHPPAPRMPAPSQAYASPWAAQGQQAFQQYGMPQGQPQPQHAMPQAQPPMPAHAAAPAGNNPYVPCPAPYYWCVPALPGQ